MQRLLNLRSLRVARRRFSAESLVSLQTLTDEELMLKDAVAKFARQTLQPMVSKMDENELLDKNILKGLFEQGFMGIETDMEIGGTGASFMSAILVVEELAKVDPAVSVVCDVQNTLVNTLLKKYGTAAQQKKYLGELATKKVGCFCLSEATSGSDAFAMKSTARKEVGKYILNGTKMW